jgi:hypothetical protein
MDAARRVVLTRLAGGALALAALAPASGALPGAPIAPAEPPPELQGLIGGVRLQGQMRLRWFGLHVYDGRLWSAERVGAADYAGREFALELAYARRLQGTAIAERSLDEMRRIAEFSDAQAELWRAFMREAFPDVQAGDRLTGWHRPGVGVRFFHNAQPTRALADAGFASRFFGIWLSPRSQAPALRQALLGEPA